VLLSAFVTPLYIFRALFLTFHTNERTESSVRSHIHESPWVVLVPLILLAIPSVVAGQLLISRILFTQPSMLGDTVFVLPAHDVVGQLASHYEGAKIMALEAGRTLTFWLSMAGILTAWLFIALRPQWSDLFKKRFSLLYTILQNKYGFDEFNQKVLVHGTRDVGQVFYEAGDVKLIDGVFVNGSGRFVRWFAQAARLMQTGYLYHYALVMLLGVVAFLAWYMWGF
jgi:NADH-quinone oxidoreductase subunit L